MQKNTTHSPPAHKNKQTNKQAQHTTTEKTRNAGHSKTSPLPPPHTHTHTRTIEYRINTQPQTLLTHLRPLPFASISKTALVLLTPPHPNPHYSARRCSIKPKKTNKYERKKTKKNEKERGNQTVSCDMLLRERVQVYFPPPPPRCRETNKNTQTGVHTTTRYQPRISSPTTHPRTNPTPHPHIRVFLNNGRGRRKVVITLRLSTSPPPPRIKKKSVPLFSPQHPPIHPPTAHPRAFHSSMHKKDIVVMDCAAPHSTKRGTLLSKTKQNTTTTTCQ